MEIEFNLDLEKPTLGGILTLLSEATILIEKSEVKVINLYIYGKYLDFSWLQSIENNVLINYKYPINVLTKKPYEPCYPLKELNLTNFSYYSTNRLSLLSKKFNTKPILHWSQSLENSVTKKINHINSEFITIHMKYGYPVDIDLSHADPSIWTRALKTVLKNTDATMVIVGDDSPPRGLEYSERLLTAKTLELNLSEQLSLISRSIGFVGTASGICSGAIFSAIPYTIYKSPDHHAIQMQDELEMTDNLPFAHDFQKII